MSNNVSESTLRQWVRGVREWLRDLRVQGVWRVVVATCASKWFFLRGVDIAALLQDHPERSEQWDQPVVPADNQTTSVPHIIFQTWKTRDQLLPRFDYWSRTFRAQNPKWQYVRWDDADNRAFIARDFPWFLPYYDGYPREIFRADIVRLFFLFRFGGLYADRDTQCLRPLEQDVLREGVTLGRFSADDSYDETYLNAIMASSPGELFWLLAIAIAMEKYTGLAQEPGKPMPEFYTGPFIITEAARFYLKHSERTVGDRAQGVIDQIDTKFLIRTNQLNVLPDERWCPVNWLNHVHTTFSTEISRRGKVLPERWLRWIFPRSTLVTFWAHSWD